MIPWHNRVFSGDTHKKFATVLALILLFTLPIAYSAVVVPLSPLAQAEAALAMIGVAILCSFSQATRPFIIFLSCFASVRYCHWRISSSLNTGTATDFTASLVLLGAEVYGLLILFLGYFQTLHLTQRKPCPLTRTPAVDIFIPTYNEPVDVVRRTVIGARAQDYPNAQVYVLDDGARPPIEEMSRSLGAAYITRPDNRGAKAGNLNNALTMTSGEFIVILDADHIPVQGFVSRLMGFFEDPKVGLVQGAQHFFNPDPYERNLNLTGRVAPEQSFFYQVIQRGNDFWNSAFFCGSCAVLRRSALEAVGGFRTSTVTEDAHTAMEIHAAGFRSVYFPVPLAAGLATESFAGHVKQRMRWARGMAQILRIDFPLLKSGLSLPQRLNYLNAMLHFFFGVPRLVLVVAPLWFLFLGVHPMRADAFAVMAYILPHLGLSTIANSMISRRHRHSFWAAVYEVSIAPYTAMVTMAALVNPRAGKFHVTEKGENKDSARFDFQNTRVVILLLILNLLGLAVAFPLRLIHFYAGAGEVAELDAILLNSVWTLANVFVLAAAVCVGVEQPQQRAAPRIRHHFDCLIRAGAEDIPCRTVDISESGVRVTLPHPVPLPSECRIRIQVVSGEELEIEARRIRYDWNRSGQVDAAFVFQNLDDKLQAELVKLIFCGNNSWLSQTYPEDSVPRSLWYLLTTPWRATGRRRMGAPSAPPFTGRWQARYGDVSCVSTVLSGDGAEIELAGGEIPVHAASLSVSMDGRRVVAPHAIVASVSESRKITLQFQWPEEEEKLAFWQQLYLERPRGSARPQTSRAIRWTEDLK